MENPATRVGLLMLVVALTACKDEDEPERATPPECVPACRPDHVCHSGACVSRCNPPCSERQECRENDGVWDCVSPGVELETNPDLEPVITESPDTPIGPVSARSPNPEVTDLACLQAWMGVTWNELAIPLCVGASGPRLQVVLKHTATATHGAVAVGARAGPATDRPRSYPPSDMDTTGATDWRVDEELTCHDRDVMNRVVSRILEVDGGEVRTYTGDYDFYEQQRAIHATQREAAYARQQAKLEKEMRFVERFKAQVAKAAQVQSRIKKLEKVERLAPPRRIRERHFAFVAATRSGDDVVMVQNVSKSFGPRKVHTNLDLLVRRKERWAIMGANGAGKTTLLKMMAGVLSPDEGEVRIGASVTMGYFAQHSTEQLTEGRTVFEELLSHAPSASTGTIKGLAGNFGFPGEESDKKVDILSGGERARVALARILHDAPNLLVFDEPTNHLDILTKRSLVKALENYEGTMVFVSHDRAFLRAVTTHVLELGPKGPHIYPGTYDEYVTSTGHQAPGMRV